MKLTVSLSHSAPENWLKDQKEPSLPKDDFVYRITDKGRCFICFSCDGSGCGNGDHGACTECNGFGNVRELP